MFHISTKTVKFTGGDEVEFARNGIVVLTGPNNAGKSSSLEGIHARLDLRHSVYSAKSAAVSNVELRIDGTVDDYIEYLMDAYEHDKKEGTIVFEEGYSRDLKVETHRQRFAKQDLPNQVLNDLTLRLTARERLENSRNEGVDAAANTLFSDEVKEIEISEVFRRSFFKDLVLDRTRQQGKFKIVDRAKLPKRAKLFSPESRKFFDALPSVVNQGDGMRSFTRILLEVMVGEWHVIILDEPELFLHPPQIRQLARFIAEDTPPDTQIIIATHSAQFVQGLVDHASDRLEVVRLTRSSKKNSARKLDASDIKKLWSDPVIAASGILGALFHDAAILCEGDSDLKFFRMMMGGIAPSKRAVDVEFFHASGKDRIVSLVDALKHLGIVVCSIVDLDILADVEKFKRIYAAFGGDPNDVAVDLRILSNFVNQKRTQITGDYFVSRLEELSRAAKGQTVVPKEVAKQIYGLLKSSSPWGAIKEQGLTYFSGQTLSAVRRVVDASANLGLFIVPEGELEGFCRASSRVNKSAWLDDTLNRDLQNDTELESARQFLMGVLDFVVARAGAEA